jgi:hypothetical protein
MGASVGWNRSQAGTTASQRLAAALALIALACGNSHSGGSDTGEDNTGGSSGSAGSGTTAGRGGSNGGSSGTDDPGGAAGESADCAPTPLVMRRLVRLTDTQVVNSVTALAGEDAAARAVADEVIEPADERAFPPLAQRGTVLTASEFGRYDRIAGRVGENARDDFDAVTSCGSTPTDACAQDFLVGFAERAFRRPLSDDERENFLTVYDECKGFGGTIQEAVQHGVWAVLDSPGFLYRTEFGEGDVTGDEVPLTQYEMASELAYFLTDAPPDDELLVAANEGELSTPDEIGAHAMRLLSTQAARVNFEAAMKSYFQVGRVANTFVDPARAPGIEVTQGLLQSMKHESELFIERTLWNDDFRDLLVSRRAFVNAQLAMPIYGVSPPTDVDADGFGEVMLPERRAGLLTASAFLTNRSAGSMVVARGLSVNADYLCQMNPLFPEGNLPDLTPNPDWSESESASWRAQQAECGGCHVAFDPYGLVLDVFDAVGRERDTDLQGRPIPTVNTLPEIVGSPHVSSPAEMAAVFADSRAFRACMAMQYMVYALSDESNGSARAPYPDQPATSCPVDDVVRAFDESGDPSFSNLIVQIARSRALRLRRGDQ